MNKAIAGIFSMQRLARLVFLIAALTAPLLPTVANADTVSSLMPWSPNGDHFGDDGNCNNQPNSFAAENCYDNDLTAYAQQHNLPWVLSGWTKNLSTGTFGSYTYTEMIEENGGGVAEVSIGPVTACSGGGGPGYLHNDSNFATTYADFCMIQGQAPQNGGCGSSPQDSQTGQCYAPADKNAGPSCPCVGNPINPGSGNKYEIVTDFQGGGLFPLTFRRTYNSGIAYEAGGSTGADQSVGIGWTNDAAAHLSIYLQPQTYFTCTDNTGTQYICPNITGDSVGSVTVWHGDGSQEVFTGEFNLNGSLDSVVTPEQGSHGHLSYLGGVFTYQRTDGYSELYNSVGQLTAVKDTHGLQQTYTYTNGQLTSITDPNGRQMTFTYIGSNIQTVTVPAMNATTGTSTIAYGYDTSGNLTSVTYDSGMPGSTTVAYEYNDTAIGMSHALTGLKDENGNEYAAWNYDDTTGKAICSEHAPSGTQSTATTCLDDHNNHVGVDNTLVTYNADGSADVTEPTGLVRHMTFSNINGRFLLASVDKRSPTSGDATHLISYDSNGHVQSVTDFNGNVINYSIDATGLEQSRTEGANNSTYERTIVTAWYTPSGGSEMGLPKTTTEYAGTATGGTILRVTSWCYNVVGGSCSDTSSIGSVWSKTVTDPIAHASPNGTLAARTTTYTYTGGLLTKVDGPLTGLTDATTLAYFTSNSGSNDLHTVTDALGHVTTVTQYSAAGFPTSVTDMNGVVTTLGYDPRGRLMSRVVDATGTDNLNNADTIYTYYPDGLLKIIASPINKIGVTYQYSYDDAHRLTSVVEYPSATLSDTRTFTYTYNITNETYDVEEQRYASGNNTAVYDHHHTRDDGLAQVRDTDGMSNTTTSQLDANGNVTSITDPLSHVTHQYFDALNRLQQSQDPKGNYTTYNVDALDHVTDITSPRGLNTGYIYDAYGELLSQTSPDTGTTTYDYSTWVSAATIKSTDALTHTQTYTYDALYRMLSQINGQSNITYSYDDTTSGDFGIGRLHTITDFSGSSTYLYNSHGRVRSKALSMTAASQSYSLIYSYDLADNLTQFGGTGHGTINYINDSLGRPTEVDATYNGGPNERLAYSVTYEPFGPLLGLTYGNGLLEVRGFDAAYRLTSIVTKNGSTPSVQDWTYSYNNDGTIAGITDVLTTGNSQTFTYDPMQRLVTATGAYGSISIGSDPINHPENSYDPDGNRSQITNNGVTTTYAYGATNNRLLTSQTGSAQALTLGYDSDGSINNDGTYSYNYSINERIAKVFQGSTTIYLPYYNGLGQRVSNTVSNGTYSYAYDEDGHFVAELNPNNTIYSQVVWLGDRPIAYYNRDIRGSTSADVDYLHVDLLNTPRVMTTSTKSIGWSWNPDPWGNGGGATGNLRLHFPGQFYDTGDGKDQNWMRDYDPQTGRYLQSDPIGLGGGINTYIYTHQNPINRFDRTGLADSVDDAIASAIARGDVDALQALADGEGLNPSQQMMVQRALDSLNLMKKTTDSIGKLEQLLRRSQRDIRSAIEQCKQKGMPRSGTFRNPDVRVDPNTGEVYPIGPDGLLGDSIGNIFDYLP